MPVELTRGHPAASAAIRAMIAAPRVPHAIMIGGPAGVGKTTLALDLAAGLLCDATNPADRPCRACRGCRLVDSNGHADLHRLVPSGPGYQIKIGSRNDPEPGTVRALIADLVLMAVEGGARVALIEQADRMNEDAQTALLKTLEEPPAGVTIVLCADREEQLLPTVRSRSARIRLGPVGTRDIETILAEGGVADPPTAARLARLSAGRPGLARAWALAPTGLLARDEIARTLLDLLDAGPARRLTVGRDLLVRAGSVARELDLARQGTGPAPDTKRQKRLGRNAPPALPDPAPTDDEAAPEDPRETKSPAAERRRALTALVEIWRDLARDLAVVAGDERRVRDPGLLDDLRAASGGLDEQAIVVFLELLDRTGELIEANVSPELALDVLVVGWPHRRVAA
jgi:DNA polymerase-3 subunit delta'